MYILLETGSNKFILLEDNQVKFTSAKTEATKFSAQESPSKVLHKYGLNIYVKTLRIVKV